MAGRAGHALMLQVRIKVRVGFHDRVPFILVAEAKNDMGLLPVQRCMTIAAYVLGIIELPVSLKIGIGPRLAVNRGAPLIIEILMTGGAFPGPQTNKGLRNFCSVLWPFKGFRDNKNIQWPNETPRQEYGKQ